MNERPILFSAPMVREILSGTKTQTRRAVKDRHIDAAPPACFFQWLRERCPYGQPGDRLWVRETWQVVDGSERARRIVTDPSPSRGWIEYAATVHPGHEPPPRWRPSIHMPRWASRILLEITAARVERLQDISEADAIAEGVHPAGVCLPDDDTSAFSRIGPVCNASFPVARYAALWESINGVGAWEKNPLVWVIEFRRVAQ